MIESPVFLILEVQSVQEDRLAVDFPVFVGDSHLLVESLEMQALFAANQMHPHQTLEVLFELRKVEQEFV